MERIRKNLKYKNLLNAFAKKKAATLKNFKDSWAKVNKLKNLREAAIKAYRTKLDSNDKLKESKVAKLMKAFKKKWNAQNALAKKGQQELLKALNEGLGKLKEDMRKLKVAKDHAEKEALKAKINSEKAAMANSLRKKQEFIQAKQKMIADRKKAKADFLKKLKAMRAKFIQKLQALKKRRRPTAPPRNSPTAKSSRRRLRG